MEVDFYVITINIINEAYVLLKGDVTLKQN